MHVCYVGHAWYCLYLKCATYMLHAWVEHEVKTPGTDAYTSWFKRLKKKVKTWKSPSAGDGWHLILWYFNYCMLCVLIIITESDLISGQVISTRAVTMVYRQWPPGQKQASICVHRIKHHSFRYCHSFVLFASEWNSHPVCLSSSSILANISKSAFWN